MRIVSMPNATSRNRQRDYSHWPLKPIAFFDEGIDVWFNDFS